MSISTRTQIWLIFSGLGLLATWYGLSGRARLRAIFRPEIEITDTIALEDIRGARAGETVEPTDDLTLVRHTVEKGDSWARIARRYGVLDYNELARHHGYLHLRPGMVIEIPPELRERP